MLRVGQRVKIAKDLRNRCPLYSYNSGMLMLAGKEAVITEAYNTSKGRAYTINIGSPFNMWEDSNLIPIQGEWD